MLIFTVEVSQSLKCSSKLCSKYRVHIERFNFKELYKVEDRGQHLVQASGSENLQAEGGYQLELGKLLKGM
jgi:hypothetical protein